MGVGGVPVGGERAREREFAVWVWYGAPLRIHMPPTPPPAHPPARTPARPAAAAGGPSGDPGVCGAMTSGGTESILTAVKASRDYMAATRGVTRPEMIVAVSAHAAFVKAAGECVCGGEVEVCVCGGGEGGGRGSCVLPPPPPTCRPLLHEPCTANTLPHSHSPLPPTLPPHSTACPPSQSTSKCAWCGCR